MRSLSNETRHIVGFASRRRTKQNKIYRKKNFQNLAKKVTFQWFNTLYSFFLFCCRFESGFSDYSSILSLLSKIFLSLSIRCSCALLSRTAWLRACSDKRSVYSLLENLASCSSIDVKISCRKSQTKGFISPLPNVTFAVYNLSIQT